MGFGDGRKYFWFQVRFRGLVNSCNFSKFFMASYILA